MILLRYMVVVDEKQIRGSLNQCLEKHDEVVILGLVDRIDRI